MAISRRNDLLLLCYHAISHDWESPLSVTPERLEEHLALLRRRGFESVSFTDAATERSNGRRVAITFDDGCRSVYELARPILAEFGMIATLFVPTDHIGRSEPMSWPGIDGYSKGDHSGELMPMTWEQTRELADIGWEIGSHTRSHPRLTDLDDLKLAEELAGSRADCEQRLGRPCTSIAYPYGDVDDRTVAAAAQAGYAAGAALMYSPAKESPLSLRRIGLHEPDGRFSFSLKTSRPVRRAWRSPAWAVIGWAIAKVRG